MESEDTVQAGLEVAEEQLRLGLVEEAKHSAQTALQQSSDPGVLGRGYSVTIQADFQLNRLTNLDQVLQQCRHQVQQLPVQVVLLWGVVAVELQEAEAACATLTKYLTAIQGKPAGMSREDAMALSRLYAVQLLANLSQDCSAAAMWLEAGGAGLSPEQQELLLLEVEEAADLLQEQALAEWASTHAAAATDSGGAVHHCADGADMHASSDAHSIAPCAAVSPVSHASSSAAATQKGQSPFVDSVSGTASLDLGPSASGVNWDSMDQQDAAAPQPLPMQQQRLDTQYQRAALQEQDMQEASSLQLQEQQQQLAKEGVQAQAEAAAGAVAEAVAAAVQQADNPFCTITGMLETLDGPGQLGSTEAAVQDQSQQQQQQQQQAVLPTAGGSPIGAAAAAASIEKVHSIDSTSTGNLLDGKDQSSGSSSSGVSKMSSSKAATVGNTSTGSSPAAAAVQAVQTAGAAAADRAAAAAVEHQSWVEWVTSSSSRLWSSGAVQGTLHALNMQDLEPYEVVGGALLAGMIGYSVYRERKALRRGAANLAAGVAQTAQMALGFSVVNPMAVVPQTQYLR